MALDNTDPYGIDIALDLNSGDLAVWPNGALGALGGAQNCAQALMLHCRTETGELDLHPGFGAGLDSKLVGGKVDHQIAASLAYREVWRSVSPDPRFLAVKPTSVAAYNPAKPGAIFLGLTALLADGEAIVAQDATRPNSVEVLPDANVLPDLPESSPQIAQEVFPPEVHDAMDVDDPDAADESDLWEEADAAALYDYDALEAAMNPPEPLDIPFDPTEP